MRGQEVPGRMVPGPDGEVSRRRFGRGSEKRSLSPERRAKGRREGSAESARLEDTGRSRHTRSAEGLVALARTEGA